MTNASAPRAAGKTADARADDPRPPVAMIDGSPFPFDLARCVAFDLEVYPGRWLVGFRLADDGGEPKHWRINGDRGRLAKALDWFASNGRTLVGCNSERFDVTVIRAILGGFDPYAPAQSLIRDGRLPAQLAKAKLPAF